MSSNGRKKSAGDISEQCFQMDRRMNTNNHSCDPNDRGLVTKMIREEEAVETLVHYFGREQRRPNTVACDSAPISKELETNSASTKTEDLNAEDRKFAYKSKCQERGCFIIFNHEIFDDKNLPSRVGTKEDEYRLQETAKHLGFEHVCTFMDYTKKQIMQLVTDLATADHSMYGYFACAILTHGGENDVLHARDEPYLLKDITREFGSDKCPTLAGKPKLFFVQACRGLRCDKGAVKFNSVVSDAITTETNHDKQFGPRNEKEVIIPVESDFLIAQSTVADYYSWRNAEYGSVFIFFLCHCLKRYGRKLELMQILTRVNRMVAYEFTSYTADDKTNNKKQIPSIISRLTAEVFFP